MPAEGHAAIHFLLNGEEHQLTRELVDARPSDAVPLPITKHAVHINGTWFPVKQAFGLATGVPTKAFVSQTARQHLARLGFAVRPETGSAAGTPVGTAATAASGGETTEPQWPTETNVQAAVVRHIAGQGWQIRKVADTAAKEAGTDIVAQRGAETLGVEVKGYPSAQYADPAKAGQPKKTNPPTQVRHRYAAALLSALRLRDKEPS
jgi:hypothetical protein